MFRLSIFLLILLVNGIFACNLNYNLFDDKIDIPELGISVNQFEISIGSFKKFIEATSYVTTADSLQWSGVFDVANKSWSVAAKANWQKPTGQKVFSHDYPATQISYYDACAYCAWQGGRLPTEKEWDNLAGTEIIKGNVWEGNFPHFDEGKDGYKIKVAPVGQFRPNNKNIHDLFGNVWEWTSSQDASGMMVIKGGSFLCDLNVCKGYIPSHYQTTAKDSGLNHLGFRCVYELE